MAASAGQVEDPVFYGGLLLEKEGLVAPAHRIIRLAPPLGRPLCVFEYPARLDPELVALFSVFAPEGRFQSAAGIRSARQAVVKAAMELSEALERDRAATAGRPAVVDALMLAMGRADLYLYGHSRNVARFARRVAMAMGLPEAAVRDVYHGALLHDIGKLGLRPEIMERQGMLTLEEFAVFRRHPLLGAHLLACFTCFGEAISIVRDHHERLDGGGYPARKRRGAIGLGARIVAACDAFDAMISRRSNTTAIAVSEALSRLRTECRHDPDARMDPRVVTAFMAAFEAAPSVFAPFTRQSAEADLAAFEARRFSGAPSPEASPPEALIPEAAPRRASAAGAAGEPSGGDPSAGEPSGRELSCREPDGGEVAVAEMMGRIRRHFGMLCHQQVINAFLGGLRRHPDFYRAIPLVAPEQVAPSADGILIRARERMMARRRGDAFPPMGILPT